MSEKDYVLRAKKLKIEATFQILDVYNLTKDWFNEHNYDLLEKEYHDITKKQTIKEGLIKFEAEKKVDEYVKFHIDLDVKVTKCKEVKIKDKVYFHGDLEFEFDVYLEKDYQERWEAPLRHFVRGISDKFVFGNKYDRYSNELKEEVEILSNEIKSYLNLYKFKTT